MDTSSTTWVNLKVLSQLEPFQKLNTRRTHFQIQTYHTGYFTIPEFVLRWWVGSNRESDFVRLKELYQSAIKILESDKEMISHLQASLKGLESLKKTYENDTTTKAKIDWLIQTVHRCISNKSQRS